VEQLHCIKKKTTNALAISILLPPEIYIMQTKDYIVDTQGCFRFTKRGLKNQVPLFAKADIDAKCIRTYDEYLQARQSTRPYFSAFLQEATEQLLKEKPNTLEWQAIRSIAFGSSEEQNKLLEKLKQKQFLKII